MPVTFDAIALVRHHMLDGEKSLEDVCVSARAKTDTAFTDGEMQKALDAVDKYIEGGDRWAVAVNKVATQSAVPLSVVKKASKKVSKKPAKKAAKKAVKK